MKKLGEDFEGLVDGTETSAEMPEDPAGTAAWPGACAEKGVGA